jgi:hypothetical protein
MRRKLPVGFWKLCTTLYPIVLSPFTPARGVWPWHASNTCSPYLRACSIYFPYLWCCQSFSIVISCPLPTSYEQTNSVLPFQGCSLPAAKPRARYHNSINTLQLGFATVSLPHLLNDVGQWHLLWGIYRNRGEWNRAHQVRLEAEIVITISYHDSFLHFLSFISHCTDVFWQTPALNPPP